MRKKDPQNERKNPRGAETSYMRLQKYGNTKLRDYETTSAIDCRNDRKYVNNGRPYTIHITTRTTPPVSAQCCFSTQYLDWRGPTPLDASRPNAANASEYLIQTLQTHFRSKLTQAPRIRGKGIGAMPCDVRATTRARGKHAERSTELPLPQEHQSAAQRASANAIM